MAQFALKLQVFIAAPNDVSGEKDIASKIIEEVARKVQWRNIMVVPYRWDQNATPGLGRPQDLINPSLNESELAIVIFGERIGSPATADGIETGVEEELRLIQELIKRGESDEVFVYFKRVKEESVSDPEQFRKVREIKQQMASKKTLFSWSFNDLDDFEKALDNHLNAWINRWERVLKIAEFTLKNSFYIKLPQRETPENKIFFLRNIFNWDDYNGAATRCAQKAVVHYQQGRSSTDPVELTGAEVSELMPLIGRPLMSYQKRYFFSSDDWFHLFCARGLVDSIVNDDISAVRRLPYINNVHQLVSEFVKRKDDASKTKMKGALIKWLQAENGEPIARNYAAYTLGMLGVSDAADALAKAARTDLGLDVKLYCITSLGKIRARKHRGLLVELYDEEPELRRKTTIGQALCRMVGLIDYEL